VPPRMPHPMLTISENPFTLSLKLMNAATTTAPTLEYREAKLGPVNPRRREVAVAFSSENPVDRGHYLEVLGHAPGEVRLDRLNSGAPVLMGHDLSGQVGVVTRAFIDRDRVGRGVLKISKSSRGQEVMTDLEDGILRQVSVGYRIHAVTDEDDSQGRQIVRAIDWEPYEISLVSVPADGSVGVGRHFHQPTEGDNIMEPKASTATRSAGSTDHGESPEVRATTRERERLADITSLAKRFPHVQERQVQDWISSGTTGDQVRRLILESMPTQSVYPTAGADQPFRHPDASRFSLVRAINLLANSRPLDGLEGEVSQEMSKRTGRKITDANRMMIPSQVFEGKRALQAEDASAGGWTVGTQVGPLIEMLRNRPVVQEAGATLLTGLQGDVQLPRHTGTSTAEWLDETTADTLTDATMGAVLLTPHRLSNASSYSKQLLAQSSLSIEAFVRNDLSTSMAIELDRAALFGTGGAGEPVGIANTAGINTMTYGATATWTKILEAPETLQVDNAARGTLTWIVAPATEADWRGIVKVANNAVFLWDDDNRVAGYRALVTNQIPASGADDNKTFFGNFADLIIGEWDGLDVVVDPYSLSLQHQIRVVVTRLVDLGVRNAVSFCVSTDAGDQ